MVVEGLPEVRRRGGNEGHAALDQILMENNEEESDIISIPDEETSIIYTTLSEKPIKTEVKLIS